MYESTTFDSLFGLGNQLFSGIILFVSAGVCAHICYGYGTKKAKDMFAGLILLTMACIQLYHLINAAIYMPATRFYTYNDRYTREDCLSSDKGGKRAGLSMAYYDENPCYCLAPAKCYEIATGDSVSAAKCLRDEAFQCLTPDNHQIKPYVKRTRDCEGGQLRECSKDQPCHPCEMDTLLSLNFSKVHRCSACSSTYKGDCNFIEGVGPYCYAAPNSKSVVPCKKCCSDPTPIFVGGRCY